MGCDDGGGGVDHIEDGTLILWLLHTDGYREVEGRGQDHRSAAPCVWRMAWGAGTTRGGEHGEGAERVPCAGA